MNLPVEYMNLSLRLCRAAENNDVWELYIVEAKNPDLLHCSLVWGENPLHIACKHGSLQFVEKILKLIPGLATKRNDHGFSPMHVAAANGHHAIVQVLAELDPRLCLVGDIDCKIPLHVAAMEGKEDVVRALVIACPESLRRVTSQGETALHLALKFGQCGAFKVLIEELRKFNPEGELLNRKDYQGNTVLHIATSHKLIEIVKLLLVGDSTNGTLLVDVNAINERGYTTLDVHNNTSNDTLARGIHHILCDVGALEGRFLSNYKEKLPPSHRQKRRYKIVSLEVRNVLIMVFVMIATLTFTASCGPQIVYQPQNPKENQLFVDWHLVLGGSNQFRAFYYMMFNIAGFIASMGAILVLIWPLPFRAVLTFVLVTTLAIYVILVDKTMPRFNIMLGSSHISSTMFVWLAALAFILCGATIWVLAKLCVWLFAKFF